MVDCPRQSTWGKLGREGINQCVHVRTLRCVNTSRLGPHPGKTTVAEGGGTRSRSLMSGQRIFLAHVFLVMLMGWKTRGRRGEGETWGRGRSLITTWGGPSVTVLGQIKSKFVGSIITVVWLHRWLLLLQDIHQHHTSINTICRHYHPPRPPPITILPPTPPHELLHPPALHHHSYHLLYHYEHHH